MFSTLMLAFTCTSFATEMPALAKKNHCTNCHAIEVKMIGPSWMDVSRAYNNNGKTSTGKRVSEILSSKTAEEWLKQKISFGGAGTWGTVLMPGIDPASTLEDKMDKLITDIMGLAKGKTSSEDFTKMANSYRCTSCHAMDQQSIGPSWMDISNVYNNNGTTPYGVKVSDILRKKTAEEWLMLKVSHGGLGNWGGMLMPAMEYVVKPGSFNTVVNEDERYSDMQELVRFILDLAKK